MKKALLIFLVIIVIGGVGAGAWIYFNGGVSLQPDDEEWTIVTPPPIQASTTEPAASTDSVVKTEEPGAPDTQTPTTTTNEASNITEENSETIAEPVVEEIVEEEPKSKLTLPLSGELVFEAGSNNIGKGTYQYTALPNGGMDLFSEGEFKFKITVIEVTIPYRQQARYDANLRPTFYASQFKGVMGFGNQSSQILVNADNADVTWNKNETNVEVPGEPFALMGMFSSYIALWSLLDQMPDRTAEAMMVRGGGPPGEEERENESPVFQMKLSAIELPQIEVQSGEDVFFVDRFAIAFDDELGNGGFQFLIQDGQWAGFVGFGENSESGDLFKVYRADIFPDGLELLGDLKQLSAE